MDGYRIGDLVRTRARDLAGGSVVRRGIVARIELHPVYGREFFVDCGQNVFGPFLACDLELLDRAVHSLAPRDKSACDRAPPMYEHKTIPGLAAREIERLGGDNAALRVVLVHVEELCGIWRNISKHARDAGRGKEADVWETCAKNLEERVNLGGYLRRGEP